MLRKVLGYQRGQLMGDWRRLHGEELHAFVILVQSVVLLKGKGKITPKQAYVALRGPAG
jgi:hypothetical protein